MTFINHLGPILSHFYCKSTLSKTPENHVVFLILLRINIWSKSRSKRISNKMLKHNSSNKCIGYCCFAGLVPDTPQTTVQIPADGNIQSFSPDDMAVFFRCMKIDELIIQRLKRKKLDGKKFSRLRDIDLEEIGIKNPIVCYFRDRSKKQRIPFML